MTVIAHLRDADGMTVKVVPIDGFAPVVLIPAEPFGATAVYNEAEQLPAELINVRRFELVKGETYKDRPGWAFYREVAP